MGNAVLSVKKILTTRCGVMRSCENDARMIYRARFSIAEQSFGEYGIFKWGDDNWAIPVISMITILGLMAINKLL